MCSLPICPQCRVTQSQSSGTVTAQLRVPRWSPGHRPPRAASWGPPRHPMPSAGGDCRQEAGKEAAPRLCSPGRWQPPPRLWVARALPATPGAERPQFVMAVSACPPVHPACPLLFLAGTRALGVQRGPNTPENPHQREWVGAPPHAGAVPGSWGCPALPGLCWSAACSAAPLERRFLRHQGRGWTRPGWPRSVPACCPIRGESTAGLGLEHSCILAGLGERYQTEHGQTGSAEGRMLPVIAGLTSLFPCTALGEQPPPPRTRLNTVCTVLTKPPGAQAA